MSSWDDQFRDIRNVLDVRKATIFGLGEGTWGSLVNPSQNQDTPTENEKFDIPRPEQKEIIKSFEDFDSCRINGVKIEGVKYYVTEALAEKDRKIIKVKRGADGAFLFKTNLAVLVAVYEGPTQAPECYVHVDKIYNHLLSVGY